MTQPPLPQRAIGFFWYCWGESMYQWGLRTHERAFYDTAITAFSRALVRWPTYAAAYRQRGLILSRELGNHERGDEDLTRAIACAPDRADLYLQRGLIRRFHGTREAAAADLRHFLDLAPTSTWRSEAERQLAQLANEHN